MKVAFFSNFLNHHQVPFCEEMIKLLGSDFVFISTESMPISFKESGYPDYENISYNHLAYLTEDSMNAAIDIANTFDVVIIGSAPELYINNRIRNNKLTFRYSERWHKSLSFRLLNPRRLLYIIKNHTLFRSKNLYMLCASAFTKQDVSKYLAYPDKCYKWGYFTKVEYLSRNQLIRQNDKIQLLWVGRFIEWKHPELAIYLAEKLKRINVDFELKMIGNGTLFNNIRLLVSELGLDSEVKVLEALPNEQIREIMLNTDIFIFTSDRNEGWGAVLSEAMSMGCASVVSDQIGAAPYLIKHCNNGLLFKSNDIKSLYTNVVTLIENEDLRKAISLSAYQTMVDYWNPSKAAKNLLELASSLIDNKSDLCINEGPCSKA